jgi:alcohol oxidase
MVYTRTSGSGCADWETVNPGGGSQDLVPLLQRVLELRRAWMTNDPSQAETFDPYHRIDGPIKVSYRDSGINVVERGQLLLQCTWNTKF